MLNEASAVERVRRSALTGLLVVSFANLLNYFDRGIFFLMLQPISEEFSFTDTQLGSLAGAFAVLFAFMSLPLAWAADQTRRLTVLGVCTAIWSLATAATGLANSFWQLFAARVGVGMGEAGCLPTGTSLIGDYYPAERRSRAMAVFQGSGLVGSMLGLMVVGMLADQVGWRMALIYASLPGFVLVPIALWLREPRRGGQETSGKVELAWLPAVGVLVRSPAYLMLLGAITCLSLGFSTIGSWGPTYFIRAYGLSLTEVGLLFGMAFGMSAAVGTFLGGFVTSKLVARNRHWEFWVPSAACALSVPLFQIALAATTANMGFLLIGLACFVAFFCYGPIMSIYHIVSPPAARATAVAAGACLAGIIGSFGGPFAVGWLTDFFRPDHGDDALRYALSIVMLVLLVPAGLYAFAGRIAFARIDRLALSEKASAAV